MSTWFSIEKSFYSFFSVRMLRGRKRLSVIIIKHQEAWFRINKYKQGKIDEHLFEGWDLK